MRSASTQRAPPPFFTSQKMKLFEAVILLSLALLGAPLALAYVVDPPVAQGTVFVHELARKTLFNDIDSNVELSLLVSQRDRAGLPPWLSVVDLQTPTPTGTGDTATEQQGDQEEDTLAGVLYGTPPQVGEFTFEIFATRLDTYETQTSDLTLTVEALNGFVFSEVELYITNFNVEEFARTSVLGSLQDVLNSVFQVSSTKLTRVTSPLAEGLEIPPPPNKQGVLVRATPGPNVSGEVPLASDEEAGPVLAACTAASTSTASGGTNPLANYGLLKAAGFDVDWCRFQVFRYIQSTGSSGGASTDTPGQGDSTAVTKPQPSQKSSISLVVILVVIAMVVVLVVSGLAWVFFGGRRRGLYVKHHKREMKMAVLEGDRASTQGPAKAQRYLRDLAQARPTTTNSGGGAIGTREGGGARGASMDPEPPASAAGHSAHAVGRRPRRRQASGSADVDDGDQLLEYHDVVDRNDQGSDDSASKEPPPKAPPYSFPNHLFPQQPTSGHVLGLRTSL